VSQADADKWNERYREGAYATRTYPSAFVEQWLPRLEIDSARPRALDIGCGAGRNALHLARHGWHVDAIDVSAVALDQLAAKARAEELEVNCIQADLDAAQGLPQAVSTPEQYDLALVIRYTQLPLLGRLAHSLRPGGYLIVELHLQTDAEVVGPRNPKFRVAPGALCKAAEGLQVVFSNEGLVQEPDGRTAALAQLVARRE
jgi:tellurite methyltransferase